MSKAFSSKKVRFVDDDLDLGAHQLIKTFEAAGTIVTGHVVSLDVTQTETIDQLTKVVTTPKVSTGGQGVIGVAQESVAAEEDVDVVIAGYCPDTAADTGLLAGKSVVVGNTANGQVVAYASGTHTATSAIGFSLAAEVSSAADIWLYPRAF